MVRLTEKQNSKMQAPKNGLVNSAKKPKKKPTTTKNKKGEETSTRLVLKKTVGKAGPKIKITDNTTPKKSTTLSTRRPLQITIPSPYRFPVPTDKMVGQISRYAGVAFVFIGGLFSLFNLHAMTDLQLHTANNIQSAELISATSNTSGGDVQKPEVRMSVTVTDVTNTSAGKLMFLINVADALEIKLIGENKTTHTFIPIGYAEKIDATTWKYALAMDDFPVGEYQIRAVIKNAYGNYEYVDDVLRTIAESLANQIAIPESSTTSTSTTAEVPVVVSEEEKVVILHTFGDTPLQKTKSINIFALGASDLKVYARNVDTLNLYYIGYAIQQSETEWKALWDTTKLPDGQYKLQAKALINGIEVMSLNVRATIDNVDVVQTAITTPIFEIPDDENNVLNPNIELEVKGESPLSKFVDIDIEASNVSAVEMYVLPKNALTPFFLGLARKKSSELWQYTWDTTQTPNGTFDVFARVKTAYGYTEGAHTRVSVLNQIAKAFTPEQESSIDVLAKASDGLTKITAVEQDPSDDIEPAEKVETEDMYIEPTPEFIDTLEVEDVTRAQIDAVLSEFEFALNQRLNELAKAMRNGDESALKNIKSEIDALNQKFSEHLTPLTSDTQILEKIQKYISSSAFDMTELTIKNEMVLKERIGEVIVTDSDKDEISDYDEINLYKTNPFVADSDGDSYIDSAEVLHGYNPNDSRNQALVVYESPKETGIVREDILIVENITTLSAGNSTEQEEVEDTPNRAILSGKGLPSSFVTLYIYSTPVVVTVKTDAQGNWTYILDKELEDGEHSVYVGITDNAGHVVAKSNPFAFVKTAEAFTKAGSVSAAISATEAEPKLFNNSMLLLVASIAIVAIGLVLILLGLHVRDKRVLEPVPA